MFLGHELPISRAAASNVTGKRERSPQGGFLPEIMRVLRHWRDRDRPSGAMLMAAGRDPGIPPCTVFDVLDDISRGRPHHPSGGSCRPMQERQHLHDASRWW